MRPALNEPGEKFCDECGAALVAPSAAPAPVERRPERRLVTVLFADLVGFTPLSEARDPEDVARAPRRATSSRAGRSIERYGGTVEKFIGDAVMAVWGTPVAHEDDAERAVRAALDLVDAVRALGDEVGADLRPAPASSPARRPSRSARRARAWSPATSSTPRAAAVGRRARHRAGRRGDPARHRAAIVYEDAGAHELKGKAEPVPLWRARASSPAWRAGADGLEPPSSAATASCACSRSYSTPPPRSGAPRLVS